MSNKVKIEFNGELTPQEIIDIEELKRNDKMNIFEKTHYAIENFYCKHNVYPTHIYLGINEKNELYKLSNQELIMYVDTPDKRTLCGLTFELVNKENYLSVGITEEYKSPSE